MYRIRLGYGWPKEGRDGERPHEWDTSKSGVHYWTIPGCRSGPALNIQYKWNAGAESFFRFIAAD
jgi:hypothetical protein